MSSLFHLMIFRDNYNGSKRVPECKVEDVPWGNLAPYGNLDESASHHLAPPGSLEESASHHSLGYCVHKFYGPLDAVHVSKSRILEVHEIDPR